MLRGSNILRILRRIVLVLCIGLVAVGCGDDDGEDGDDDGGPYLVNPAPSGQADDKAQPTRPSPDEN